MSLSPLGSSYSSKGCLMNKGTHRSSTPSPSALLDLTRLYQASETAVSLTAYVMPCVRFNRFVR